MDSENINQLVTTSYNLSQRLTADQALAIYCDLDAAIVKPYKERARHLNTLLQRLCEIARVIPPAYLKQALPSNVLDDLTGTWVAMQAFAAPILQVQEIPTMGAVGQVVTGFAEALRALYIENNAAPLKAIAKKYGEKEELPELPIFERNGKKGSRGSISVYTATFGEWLTRKTAEGYNLYQAVQAILAELSARPKDQRSPDENKFIRKMSPKNSQDQAKAASDIIRAYQGAKRTIIRKN